MTDAPLVLECLMVSFPVGLEEELLDLCHATPGLTGFTLVPGSGFGTGAGLRTAREVVLGRADRLLLVTTAAPAVVDALLEALQHSLPTPDIAYWSTPVQRFGHLV